jgi:hypothetical protein
MEYPVSLERSRSQNDGNWYVPFNPTAHPGLVVIGADGAHPMASFIASKIFS